MTEPRPGSDDAPHRPGALRTSTHAERVALRDSAPAGEDAKPAGTVARDEEGNPVVESDPLVS